ncbi:hypothetical protein Lal_00020282 [Lupinus albus]|uniref:Putative fasciclin-like arabinogalactan protein n=1 Tax=Lupinus albus TaxID=3870 RepID=A0A6A5MGA3_LUPAL|nr:putative fasciclin-like arabinogalactan protein [Lupinus albus]KAF1871488.1 hypothetical protein Lal_00020282 [Lupinus albus]
MGYKTSSFSCLALLLAFSSCIHAFDVMKIFGSDPEFSQFSKAMNDTKLAEQINKRNTITILALNNGAMSSLNGKSLSTLKDILSTHVLLDFYDEKSFFYANTNHTQIVTLFQASGKAVYDQGFIYVSLINEGELAFASAVKNAPYNSLLVRTLGSQPYNISVVEVSAPIIAPGIDGTPITLAPAPSSPKSNATAPGASAEVPAAEEISTTAAPAPSKVAESPVEAEAPGPVAEEAADTTEADDKAAPASSNASTTHFGLVGAVMALASLFISM